jgi:hypothetical protein
MESDRMKPKAVLRAHRRDKTTHGARGHIIWLSVVIVVPLLALTGALLWIVYAHLVQPSESVFAPANSTRDSGAFYVDYQAATIATVSSWASTVAPVLVSFIMTILSYQIASMIQTRSSRENLADLPTPFQFALLVNLINGGILALWDTLLYSTWIKRDRKASPVKVALGFLTAAMILV